MPNWSINNFIRMPLLIMAVTESFILFTSVYFAGLFIFGTLEESERVLGPLAPRAGLITVVILLSLISMGLYQFHQRIYFREVALRILVGVSIGCALLAAIFYAVPGATITRDIAAPALAYTLVLLLIARYFFVNNVDENIFRRRTLIYGAGERAAAIEDLKRRADRRGFRVVGKVPAPGDSCIIGKDVFKTNGLTILDLATEHKADEIVVAMDDRRGNLPIRELLDCRLKGIEVIDLLEFLERETGKIPAG